MRKSPILARALLCVGVAAMLAGCKTTQPQQDISATMPSDYRLRHPIAVREKVQSLTVFIGDNRGTLTPAQRTEVAAIASNWQQEATGGIVIEIPVGGANERAAANVSHEIRSILASTGVPGNAIEIRTSRTQDPVRLGTIRVNYPKMAAETGPCGLWPSDIGPTYDRAYWQNKPYWNHGCSNQRNLAAQVADPADLVQPRAEGPTLASRRAVVTDKYRKGEGTATTYPDANKGKISDLGQ
jgi:pilus assembly protein CpaD